MLLAAGLCLVRAARAQPADLAVLQLLFHDGTAQSYTLSFEDGKTFLEGRRWLRTCNPDDQVVEARPQCW